MMNFQWLRGLGDICVEYCQTFKFSHPDAYQRAMLVLQPAASVLYLYDVYSDIQVAQVYFQTRDYIFAGLTTFFITFHHVLTGVLLARLMHMPFPVQEQSQAGNKARRVSYIRLIKRLRQTQYWATKVVLHVILSAFAVPFLDMLFLFQAIFPFPFIFYILGANEDFMLQYAHSRKPMECFLESIPQTIIQVAYWQLHGNDTKESEKWILLSSIAASAFNLFLNLLNLLSVGWKDYFSLTLRFQLKQRLKSAMCLPTLWRERLEERILLIDRSILGEDSVMQRFLWDEVVRRGYVVLCNEEDVGKYTGVLKQQRAKSAAVLAVDSAEFMLMVSMELPRRLIERNQSPSGKALFVYFDFRRIPDLALLGYSGMAIGDATKVNNATAEDELGEISTDDEDNDSAKDEGTMHDMERKQLRLELKQQRSKNLETLIQCSGARMVAHFMKGFHLAQVGKEALGKQLWLDGLARVSFADCGFILDNPGVVQAYNDDLRAPWVQPKAESDLESKADSHAAHSPHLWEGLHAITKAPNLQMLDLSGNRLGVVGTCQLAKIMADSMQPTTKRLLELRLRDIGFGSQQASMSSTNSSSSNSNAKGVGSNHSWPTSVNLRTSIAFLARRAMRLDLSRNTLPCQPMFEVLVQCDARPGEQDVHDLVMEHCTFAPVPQGQPDDGQVLYQPKYHVKEPWKWKTGIELLSFAGTCIFPMHQATPRNMPCSRPLFSQMLAHGQLQQVQKLNLSYTGLTADTQPSWFALHHPELQHVHQTCHHPDDVLKEDLPTKQLLPSLRSLDLSSNVLGDSGLEALVLELAKLSESLQELSLAHVGAGLMGIHQLLSTLCNKYNWKHEKLTSLDVSYNAGYLLSHGALGNAQAADLRGKCSKSLVQLLQLHTGLTRLDLSGVHLSWLPGPDFTTGSLLSDILKTGKVLTGLHLNNVPFGNDGIALLAKALKERMQPPDASRGLGSRSNSNSRIGRGCAPLALRVLSLSRVNMDSLGFGFLLDALAYDPEMPLQQLDLSYNRIRYMDIDEWKRFLAVNRNLCSLDLQFNLLAMDVWSKARDLLQEALEMRRTELFDKRDDGKHAEQLEVLA